jgi:hypothetical protein
MRHFCMTSEGCGGMFIAKKSTHVIGGDDQPYQVCADGERGPHRRDQKLLKIKDFGRNLA